MSDQDNRQPDRRHERNRAGRPRDNAGRGDGQRAAGRPYGSERRDGPRRTDRHCGEGADRSQRRDRPQNRKGGRPFGERGGLGTRDGQRQRGERAERRGEQPPRKHAQRGGAGRDKQRLHPQRSGFREERLGKRINEPEIPADVDFHDLDPMVLQDLKVLSKHNGQKVAAHLAAAAILMADEPVRALEHARAAKDRAGRVAVTRETVGIAAYHAGEWHEALSELRAARRMSGGPGLLAVMADCERGLGRPERALEIARSEEASQLDPDQAAELTIVAAGARLDMGNADAAVTTLEAAGVSENATGVTAARLSYALADALLAAGRHADAEHWFKVCQAQDVEELTDAAVRVAELAGTQDQPAGGEDVE